MHIGRCWHTPQVYKNNFHAVFELEMKNDRISKRATDYLLYVLAFRESQIDLLHAVFELTFGIQRVMVIMYLLLVVLHSSKKLVNLQRHRQQMLKSIGCCLGTKEVSKESESSVWL